MADQAHAQEMGARIGQRIVDLGGTVVIPLVLWATGLTEAELVEVVEGRRPISSLTLYRLAEALQTSALHLATGETHGLRVHTCVDDAGQQS